MRHGHGTTNNNKTQRVRRVIQPGRDGANDEANRQHAQRGGQPDVLGVTQGQNGEQGNTVDSNNSKESGKIRH